MNSPRRRKTLLAQMAPPPQVLDLVQRFDGNREAYKSPHYNETQLRREFLDPLFRALGWDIYALYGLTDAEIKIVEAATA